ncbi:hemagglutinin repeat-containing protein [Comamonas endophytica]|uniref:Hemagglutinin repeat-containing protein n=1 Tax=Comamonas endophytica TaxID=2949090 RepID=A0ABY6G7N4_9BURK|nr:MULTISPECIES: hemagglutinin repeat-containing protein [unclassified Acidovorax]MCD2511654.1 hemagglutinin repeat-containing protein [Acidovorax sp. D4N7]UYG51035.1 hemagglutinin repeat-containing protein [Acidovorax sp. 5MLIR]
MNQQRYRLIFSRVRGIWMAVQEAARAGRGPRSEALALPAATSALLLAASTAFAQIIPDASAPGHERPTVLRSANGMPAVNIQTPSTAGVSRNRYQQFDIGQQGERGAILNNSRTGVQSQIGGAVQGNPWLARGSARVIVNEVNSANQSRLSGALEVAGPRADVIIANPSGLVVNGLSLINAAGLTLAGAQPVYRSDGSLEAFRVQRGAIQLEGRGLDAAQADYAQVLAQAIAVNAGIWAQDLRMVTGTGPLAADSTQQPLPAQGAPARTMETPQFALDVAQLGGMYARKIMLIGTEAGLGVRNAGALLADAGPLTLTAGGQLRNTGVIASQGADAELQLSARSIDNSGRLVGQRDVVLADGGAETLNAGSIEAGRELAAQAGQLNNQANAMLSAPRLDIMATRLDNAGHIAQTGTQALAVNSLAISNSGEKALLGAPTASMGTQPAPAAPSPDPAPPTLADGQIHVAQRLTNTGLLTANGTTDVKAIHSFTNSAIAHLGHLHSEGLLDNRRGTLQMQRLTGAQGSVMNQGGSMSVAGDLRLVARQLDNTGGTIASAGSLTAKVPSITNDAGTLRAAGDLTVKGETLSNQRNALLVSQTGHIRLTLDGALNNQQGQAVAPQGLEISSGSLNNSGGILHTTGERSLLKLTSSTGVDNSTKGLIQSGGDLQLHAGTEPINNTAGTLQAQQDLLIQSRGLVDNSQGHLQAGRQLLLQDASVAAGAPLDQATQTLLNQGGTVFSADSLQIKNKGLDGAGRLDAVGGITLDFAGDIMHQGIAASNAKLKLETAGKLTNQGQLLGGTDTELKSTQIDNQAGATMSAAQTITLRTGQPVVNRGLIDGQDTRIDADTIQNIGTGRIFGDHVSLAAKTLENRPEDGGGKPPVIASRKDMDLGVPVVINQGGALLQSMGHIRMGNSLDANRIATGNGQELRNIAARIDAQGDIQFDQRVVNNLNANLVVEPFAEVENIPGENMVAFSGKAPESATLYKEIEDGLFLPYFENRGRFYTEMGIQGYNSDGRMFKPVHIDRFPHIPPAAFIDPKTSYRNGVPFPDDAPLQLEPAGSPRFAQFGIAVPENYTATAPDPLNHGGIKEESGRIGWQSLAEQRAYEAAFKIYQESIAVAQKLHEKILEVAKEDNRYTDSSRGYTVISQVKLTIHADSVKETKPAIIEAGGNIHFKGPVNNINAIVRAGALIDPKKPPYNEGRQGNRKTRIEGSAMRYDWKERRNKQKKYETGPAPYTYTYTKIDTFPLPTVVFKSHHPYAPSAPVDANSNTGNSTQRPTPVVREQIKESRERVRTLESAGTVPQNSLYWVRPENPNRPLVETDPAFTRGRQWTSSEQMLRAFDPAPLQKRLGDGFYEQQLVQQQLGYLTGQRFLGDYRANDAQYQALLQSGTTFAKAHGLRPGVALSAAQMAQLTSDLVWLVEEKLTLPDASRQTVLVPKVYVVAQPGDLDAQGGLISADQLLIDTDKDMHNSASLRGRRLLHVAAHDINNVGGNMFGRAVDLAAKRDINVHGGTVAATEALLARAERDINAPSITEGIAGSGTEVNRRTAFELRPGAAAPAAPVKPGEAPAPSGMQLYAGRNADLRGTSITNAVRGSKTSIAALHDIDLSAIHTSHSQGVVWDHRNRLLLGGSHEVGTTIDTLGDTDIHAGRNIYARATQVVSTGHLDVDAGTSVRIDPGQATRWLDDAYHSRHLRFLGSSSRSLVHQVESSEVQPSFFGGKTVHIKSGQDIDVTGSQVLSIEGTRLDAKGKVNLLAAQENASWQSQQRSRRSGVFGGNGLGLTIGSQRQNTEQSVQSTASAPSVVRSLKGNVDIKSGSTYRQIGSDVIADEGDIDVDAKRIETAGGPQTAQGSMHSSFRQGGLGFSINAPVIGMAQTASSLADAASQTGDGRMHALAGGAAALNVYNQRKDLQKLAEGDLGLRTELMLGSSRSWSQSTYSSSNMRQSHVLAPRGNVTMKATGDGGRSDLVLQDSQVDAGKVAKLIADHKIYLGTTPDTRSDSSSNRSRSAGLGISLGGTGPAVIGSGSRGEGRAESEDQTQRQTQVKAGQRVEIYSGSDTVMRDASIQAPRVKGSIGGRLRIKSLQDTSRFDGTQSDQAGSFGIGPGMAAASDSHSTSRAQANYASVKRPSGIFAGDGGFDLEVKDITELGGGVITSTQPAIDNKRNRLITRAIIPTDIENRSDYTASGFSLSGGLATGGQEQAKSAGSDTVTKPTGWSAQNLGKLGVSAAGMGVSSDQGSERSITRSGISPGEIIITDDAAQRGLTGQSAAEAVANLNRDVRTDDPSQGLSKRWNGQQLMDDQAAKAKIAAALGQQASRATGTYAKEQMGIAADLRRQAQQDPARAAELMEQAQAIESKWGDKGTQRLGTHGLVGAFTGGVPGAVGAVVGTVAAPIVADALRNNNLSPPLIEGITALASTAAGGLAGGGAVGAAAAFNEVTNNHLPHDERALLNKSQKSCYTEGDISSCETAAALNKKDQLSDRLLANAVATCQGSDCNEISNHIQEQMHELGCPIPHSCATDRGKLLDFWKVAQSKAQGLDPIYPESWLLDAKALLDFGKYGIKLTNVTAKNESLESLNAARQLKENRFLKQAVPGPVNFIGDKDRFFKNLSNRQDIDPNGLFDVIAHGDKQNIYIITSKGLVAIDQRIAGKLIKDSSGYKTGQSIRLLSCETGACNTGFAQNLANKMGVPVQAPSDLVWAYPDGTKIVAPRISNDPTSPYFARPDLSKQGKFNTFLPKNYKP